MPVLEEILPSHLLERLTSKRTEVRHDDAAYILYWMRTAVRAHENAALDVALVTANKLGLPVLVYHGLDERYPYASDRFHTFILEGARDVQKELDARGIFYALNVRREGHREDNALEKLAERAALVVTEEMPIDPLRGLTSRLAARIESDTPLVTVDTACVIPMPSLRKGYDRAFAFRKGTADLLAERLTRPWDEVEPKVRFEDHPALPFEPVDIERASIPELIARCDIDHGVGPVPHTRGGSRAGYARWESFRSNHLSRYHRRRNDPSDLEAVSRMSAYLHFGHVAPTRIAREAAMFESEGSEKYIDELIVWREMAYHYCYHSRAGEVDSMRALPGWAIASLRAHEDDARPVIYSSEVLERAVTEDTIWNLGQRSLLVHGELHNNFRMTWGKMLLNWRETPARALEMIIDLNHRFALDGRDPASYGGILWCLGQFDRPFEPAQPIFGKVRAYDTASYASRKRIDAYEELVSRPLFVQRLRVAIIGAGVAGLSCARVLQDHGLDVTVFDKGYRPGGRLSTRVQREGQPLAGVGFDHGAQYFTARHPVFRRFARAWEETGQISRWDARLGSIDVPGEVVVKEGGESPERFVGVPGMRALAEHLASDLEVVQQRRVERIERDRRLLFTDGEFSEPFDVVVVNTPPAQAVPLVERVSEQLSAQAAGVEMSPCWAAMVSFKAPLELVVDGVFINLGDNNALGWAARNASKPGRDALYQTWVLHASPEWSAANLDREGEDVASALLAAFFAATGLDPVEVEHLAAHRWRYAMPATRVEDIAAIDRDALVAMCGDWLNGGRVEGAFMSGRAAAGLVLGELCSRDELLAPESRTSAKMTHTAAQTDLFM